jgi:hypothetical protein
MSTVEGGPEPLRLADLTPYISVTVLVCTADNPGPAFDALRRFVRRTATDPGRAVAVRILSETRLVGTDEVAEAGRLDELGFEELYGLVRGRDADTGVGAEGDPLRLPPNHGTPRRDLGRTTAARDQGRRSSTATC